MSDNVNELTQKWYKLAYNDQKAAKLLCKEGQFLLAAFHLQQALEKFLKLYYLVKKDEQPPYLHNLVGIATEAGVYDSLSGEFQDLLNTLNPFYIKARYPTYKKSLADTLDSKKLESLIALSDGVILWLEKEMKSLGWQKN